MTKEELKQEAEEWLCNNLHSASEEDFIKAMVDIAEPREKRIAELEERVWRQKKKMVEKTKKIVALGKENAELKAQKHISDCVEYCNTFKYACIQLTKAKELLKRFIELENCTLEYDDIKEAEQFLSEVGK